jgi:hypothetical protein
MQDRVLTVARGPSVSNLARVAKVLQGAVEHHGDDGRTLLQKKNFGKSLTQLPAVLFGEI